MIARLDGILVDRDGPRIVVDCHGVGYDVACSAYTHAALPAVGERVVLRVFTHAQENKIALFGFIDQHERAIFDLLITVKNVGPTTAIAILSGSTPREIADAIAREDTVGLTRIKGVGKKTAELLVVELREKCEELLLGWDASAGARSIASIAPRGRSYSSTSRHPLVEQVHAALVNMGWRPAEAEQAIADLPDVAMRADATIETLLVQALRSMPR